MRFLQHRQQAEEGDLRLVVGLGNPGAQYERTRHNAGYMVANEIARRMGATFRGSRQRADIARGTLNGLPLIAALPTTYMNNSGEAVTRLLNYYRIPLEHLIVIADDLDLPFGTIRVRPDGSSGGNGGLKSIVQGLGTEEFSRLRFGVGRPPGDAINYVLGPFPPEQAALLPRLVPIAADAVEAVLRDGVRAAMNQYNRDWTPEITEAS
jgi:PTH1 family peptidyl-tRNA hydrolase